MADFRGSRFRDTVTITVPLPAHEAMQIFTARGEREWADGWEPHFPTGEPAEEGEGTIFMTTSHDRPTYWVVAARTGRSVRYARVTPGLHAGTVEVRERLSDARRTEVDITYDLSALTTEGAIALDRLAAHYEEEIGGWQHAIETALGRRATGG
jgi:hypothetical protein